MRPAAASTEDLILELQDQIDLIDFIDTLMADYIPIAADNTPIARFCRAELCGIGVRTLIIDRLKKITQELQSTLDNSR